MKTSVLIAAALFALAGCAKPAPTVENAANAQESDLINRAAAMDAEAEADTNAAAANAINSAAATYDSSIDSIRTDADAAKNGH